MTASRLARRATAGAVLGPVPANACADTLTWSPSLIH